MVEVSGVVESADVERAARRAALLGRVRPTVAVVGGEEITRAASKLAHAQAVWRLEDGRILGTGQRMMDHGEVKNVAWWADAEEVVRIDTDWREAIEQSTILVTDTSWLD